MIENNVILNRLFTQNVFFDMVHDSDNTTYGTVIQRYVNDVEDKDNGTLISEVYRFMSKNTVMSISIKIHCLIRYC